MAAQVGARISLMDRDHSVQQSEQGFSLVESLFAIIILGIVFTGGIAFFYQSKMLYYHGLHSETAVLQADSQMEAIKNAGCANAPTTSNVGNPVAIDNGITGHLTITWPTTATSCSVAVDPCSASTVKACASTPPTVVGVCVTWPEPGYTTNQKVGLTTCVGS